MPSKDTYTVFSEIPDDPHFIPSSDQTADVVREIARRLEKSEKKRRKLEKKIDKLLKPGKKSKGKGKKHKKGKGAKKSNWMDGIIRESASTAFKITEMYAESKFFPDGRASKNRK